MKWPRMAHLPQAVYRRSGLTGDFFQRGPVLRCRSTIPGKPEPAKFAANG
jgi:hypothetical protein